jgi:hypothetical protein
MTNIIPKSNGKIVKRGRIDTPNTQIHDRSRSWLGTGTLIKGDGVKLVLWDKPSPLSEMIRSCKCLKKTFLFYVNYTVLIHTQPDRVCAMVESLDQSEHY